ncbi:MAG TPA: glycoside hydrolase family 88 protein, partial [Herpetosiphonaceae bacterium]|nr:glycoside hydrolase family 88 protein [Herpetosiphonaceae bacterium]
PGSLWLLYEQTKDPAWRAKAEQWQAGLESQKNTTSTHDVGFIIFTSFGNGYRLTGTDAYRQVILTAARSLATRYDPEVGSIRSWGSATLTTEFEVIIDNMMNLELLFWAARNGGSTAWYDMALSHALRTRQDHVRADGSTYQVVNYDPTTGSVVGKRAHQGYSVDSTWSRGQAWAIYGFATSYRETKDMRLLDTARQTADYFLDHLPADGVPYWDFQAPGIPNEPRDSSAAAVAAAGLVELSKQEPDGARRARYLQAARQILDSLSSAAYLAEGTASPAILLHGTQNKPDGKYDRGLIYGDYYFLEALLRYQAVTSTGPTPTAGTSATFTATTLASSTTTATRTATATSGATAPPMSGTRIKDMTFEGGLAHPSSGADRVNGAVALESSAPLYGNNAARIPNAGDVYVEENITAASDLYVSFYVRLAALPTSDARILQATYSGTTVGNFALRPNGALRLRYGSTTIGADSIPLTAGRVYRVGIHQKKGTGSDAVLEGYLAEGDAPFGTPFAATTSGTWTT